MSTNQDPMLAEQEQAFIEWRDLRAKALETGDIADAHAAGLAFGRFFYTYVAVTYRPAHLMAGRGSR